MSIFVKSDIFCKIALSRFLQKAYVEYKITKICKNITYNLNHLKPQKNINMQNKNNT